MPILHIAQDYIVVDKPSGQYVHASPGHEQGSLAQELVASFPEMARVGSVQRPGVVHRLDAQTSGVMVFARTRRGYVALRKAFESHENVKKTYLAILRGSLPQRDGSLVAAIGRKPWDPKRMAVGGRDARRAVTRWRVLGKHDGLALVEFKIETGRTHQIRVHAAHLGHPVAGDPLYGDKAKDARMRRRPERTLLHAAALAFRHPGTGRRVEFSAPPPEDIVYC